MMVWGWACSGVWAYMQAFWACMLASSCDTLVWVFCTLVFFSLHVVAACVTVPYRLAFSFNIGTLYDGAGAVYEGAGALYAGDLGAPYSSDSSFTGAWGDPYSSDSCFKGT